MTTWTTLPDTSLEQDDPLTVEIALAYRDNPIAIAEGSTSAPVVAAGWHPYDMVNIGDGATGKFYDFAVDGAVASHETPDFADGYEYMVLFDGISTSGVAGGDLRVEMYQETSLAYTTTSTISSGGGAASDVFEGSIEFVRPRLTRNIFIAKSLVVKDAATLSVLATDVTKRNATAQKILRARFSWSAGNIDAGVMYLLRRKVLAS